MWAGQSCLDPNPSPTSIKDFECTCDSDPATHTTGTSATCELDECLQAIQADAHEVKVHNAERCPLGRCIAAAAAAAALVTNPFSFSLTKGRHSFRGKAVILFNDERYRPFHNVQA